MPPKPPDAPPKKFDPLQTLCNVGPWLLLVAIFLVFQIGGIADFMGCSYDWRAMVPLFGMGQQVRVMG
jgi:hypothetical protein